MHCKACDVPITVGFLKESDDELKRDENGDPILEDLCSRCKSAAHVNMPEEWYDGLWHDREAPEHTVLPKPEDYLL